MAKVHYVNKVTTKPSKGFVNDKPSMTVKDDAYTIQELYLRARNGITPEEKEALYLDVDDFDQISPLSNPGNVDLVDVYQHAQSLEESAKALQDKLLESTSDEEVEEDAPSTVQPPDEEDVGEID